MEIDMTWYPPLPLSGGNPADLRYTVDGIEAWEDCPGVYMFCRKDGESLIPMYIGRSKNMYHRIRAHLATTTLMRRIDNGAKGKRVLMLGEYRPKSGQSSATALAIVEQALMALAFAEGYAVLNTAGTKTPTPAVTCSGFRRAKQVSGSKMYGKVAR
jgi:hypothetical protein